MHSFGWIPDIPSALDWKLPSAVGPPALLPSSVDLTSQCPPVFNQGALGSCTANAGDALWMFLDQKQGGQNLIPSRLALYYWARERQGWQASDTGAFLRDTLAVLATIGAAPETDWPYDPNKFTQKPPQKAYDDAASYKALAYMRVGQTLDAMKQCLAAGFPFVLGFTVYENFETPDVTSTGIAQMPQGKVLGGHAVMCTGYDDATRRFKVRNSWGKEWGMDGSFTIPYEYFTDSSLSDDLWTIRAVAEVVPEPPVPPDPNHFIFSADILVAKPGKLIVDPDKVLPWLKGRSVAIHTGLGPFFGVVKSNDENTMVIKGEFPPSLKGQTATIETT